MIYFFVVFILIILYKSKFCFKGINPEYMSKDNTSAIKGVYTILIIFSHIRQYQTYDDMIDKPVIKLLYLTGQLMVAMFMFYSGMVYLSL